MPKSLAHPLPEVVNPPDEICFVVRVPNDPGYIRAFIGEMFGLATWVEWERDATHKAQKVAERWRKVVLSLKAQNCGAVTTVAGADGDDFMLRQNPDNPCLLETSVDGVTWCAWADLSKCIQANPAQPSGGGQPAAGSSSCHHAVLQGMNQWLLPFYVNGGDKIKVQNWTGAWNDGTGFWYCPDGNRYEFGHCTGIHGTSGSDPLPTANHASIIADIGGTFFDATAGEFIVPSGVTDAYCAFYMNDPSLSDNSGQIEFDVCATIGAGQYWDSGNFDTSTDHIDTPFSTISGATYKVTCDGFICHNPFSTGDVNDFQYTSNDGWATHAVTPFGSGPLNYGLLMDGLNPPLLAYQSTHHYEFVTTGTGSPLVFKPVANSPYASCGGNFRVTVAQQ